MALQELNYRGINRAVSDYAGASACEELINLRPTTEGLAPVNDFTVKMQNKDFLRLFVHHAPTGDRYIAVRHITADNLLRVEQVDGEGNYVGLLFTIDGVTASNLQDVLDGLHFAYAGNVVLFSLCDKEDGLFGNYSFTWKGEDGYVETEANVPEIDYDIDDSAPIEYVTEGIEHLNQQSSQGEVISAIANALNAAQEENPSLCFGPVVIAVAFKTKDGNTFWTNNWRVYNPEPRVIAGSQSTYGPYVDRTLWTGEQFTAFFDKYGYGFAAGHQEASFLSSVYFYGTKAKLTFPALSSTPGDPDYWDEETSLIQSLEVYTSKPYPYLDKDGAYDGLIFYDTPPAPQLILPSTPLDKMELGGQLLYLQASIQMTALKEEDQEVELNFGGNIQMTEDTLDADAGALKRYGNILSYNARFHYYDSVSKIDVGKPTFTYFGSQVTPSTAHVFVRYADSERSELVYVGTTDGYRGSAGVVISPSLNAKEVVTYIKVGSEWKTMTYRMEKSSAYNYSICVGGANDQKTESSANAELEALISGGVVGITTEEPAAINVTEQYNPFVFRVEHSYLAPGRVLDVRPQMAGIVDAAYGRDPLNVFTERGVYALTQGSANVLYGAFLPVAPSVISGRGVPTEMGIFYLADGSLWLISGRRTTLISDALHLGPHKYVRACTGYKKLSGTDANYSPDPEPENPVYDVSPYLSQVTFEQYVRTGGRLGYDRIRMELYVGNSAYPYTYVLSLKYRQWFKISRAIWQDEPGSDIATVPGTAAGRFNFLDLSEEVTMSTIPLLVHYQTRPFSMGYQYSHIHRIVAMVRTRLESQNHKLAVGLYGSDDLQNWTLLAYALRSGKTEWNEQREEYEDTPLQISQIRTTTSARSWRYYTVCLGGEIAVDPDNQTDIGPVLVDYEPVVRRIG